MPMCLRRMTASWFSSMPDDRLAGHGDLALVGHVEPGDEVEQRRLAAARGAHDGHELARAAGRGRRPRSARTGAVSCSKVRYTARTATARSTGTSAEPSAVDRATAGSTWLARRCRSWSWCRSLQSARHVGADAVGQDRRLPALDQLGLQLLGAGRRVSVRRVPRRLAEHGLARLGELLEALGTGSRRRRRRVYSTRSSEPSSAAATSPVDSPMPSPNGRQALGSSQRSFTRPCAACMASAAARARSAWSLARDRGAEHGHDRVADVLHDGAALAEDRPVHLGPVGVELRGQRRRVGVLGDRRVAADVGHQRR